MLQCSVSELSFICITITEKLLQKKLYPGHGIAIAVTILKLSFKKTFHLEEQTDMWQRHDKLLKINHFKPIRVKCELTFKKSEKEKHQSKHKESL